MCEDFFVPLSMYSEIASLLLFYSLISPSILVAVIERTNKQTRRCNDVIYLMGKTGQFAEVTHVGQKWW